LENNVNFREDLIISYLSQLVSLDNRTEFDKFYPSVENYLQEALAKTKDLEVLTKIRDIISFKSKSVEMKI
jgi:hypothetical protein